MTPKDRLMDDGKYVAHKDRPFPPGRETDETYTLKQKGKKRAHKFARHGFILGLATGAFAGAIIKDCSCTGDSASNYAADAGINNNTPAYDAGIDTGEISLYDAGVEDTSFTCSPPGYVHLLEETIENLENKLEECQTRNQELSKRPESCPKYKSCPPKEKFPAYRRY